MSKIENGQVSPSLSTLRSLAAALNVPIALLFAAAEERRDCSYVRASKRVVIERSGTKAGHQYRLLGHSLAGDLAVEPYLITLSPKAVPCTAFQHAGTELIHMLTGRVAYRHDDRKYELGPGDTLMFDASAAHGPATLTELPMTYLSIIMFRAVDNSWQETCIPAIDAFAKSYRVQPCAELSDCLPKLRRSKRNWVRI
jgi:uncharacterized cupin superfamily protein